MNQAKLIFIAALSVPILSCTPVLKTATPVGGSKADGIIHMSYVDGAFENVTVDWETTHEMAKDRCVGWGYKEAKIFGQIISVCQISDSGICYSSIKTVTYQCTN
jgi:hypothetical protein